MDVQQLSAWKADLEKQIKVLTESLQSLTADLQKKREQLALVQKLLDSENLGNKPAAEHRLVNVASDGASSRELKNRVYEILRESNRPMNIKEIHAEFIRRGYAIPGKGTPFNILVHISRELKDRGTSRFYRTGRGTYALRQNSRIQRQGEAATAGR